MVVCLWGGWACAQRSGLRLKYVRQNNATYTANVNLTHKLKVGDYTSQLRIHHNHVMNTTRKEQPFVQLLLDGDWRQKYRISKRISLTSWLEGKHFFSNGAYRYAAYVGATYTSPKSDWEVTPFIGWGWDYRSGILDQGFSPAIMVRWEYPLNPQTQTQSTLFARYKDLDPRQQVNVSLNSLWTYQIDKQAETLFSLQAGTMEIDDYRLGAVERIISDTIRPGFSFRYQLSPQLSWESDNELAWTRRSLQYEPAVSKELPFNDQGFNQFDINSRQRVSFKSKKISGFLSYAYQLIDRSYDMDNTLLQPEVIYQRLLSREQEKDYSRQLSAWEAQIGWQINRKHRLEWAASNRYLQYDTPSEINYDDHDELTHGLTMNWETRWSPTFFTRYQVVGNIRQYAFLFQQRSQENYEQYGLRFGFDYQWNPAPRLSLKGGQYIYVTYNVKSFEDRNRTNRSTRNLETQQNLHWQLGKQWSIRGRFYQKGTHLSYLNWEAFSETPLDTNTIATTQISLEKQISLGTGRSLRLEVAYKHFSQIRRLNSTMQTLDNRIAPINLAIRGYQTGPLTAAELRTRKGGSIFLSIWWQYQHNDFVYNPLNDGISLGASYRQEQLNAIQTGFRPFFELRLALF